MRESAQPIRYSGEASTQKAFAQSTKVNQPVKLALAQLNPIVGDLEGNAGLVKQATQEAAKRGADLLITPEMIISGYPPKDLLLRESFVQACDRAVEQLAKELAGTIAVLIGHPTHREAPEDRIANAASLLLNGEIVATTHKTLLPNYDVFDERRYFRPADNPTLIEFRGRKLGVHICEDAWWGEPDTAYHDDPCGQFDPVAYLVEKGAEVLINLSASPFEISKPDRRVGLLERHVKSHQRPFVFVNQVGGNDDLVFDGNGLVLNERGELVAQLAQFEPDLQVVDLDNPLNAEEPIDVHYEMDLLNALTLGLKDYMRKCSFKECVLGLSGGIDSALACYIAARAVGPENVHGLLMPSRYSSDHSVDDAMKLAENLGCDAQVIPIDEVHRAYERSVVIGEELTSDPAGLADQNLQARIRGAMVMVRSNRNGWIALATGNKSEIAVGYCTLYGDMAGGFAVLSDIFKRDVYSVSRYINEVVEQREVIPDNIINKAPSAELAPDQFDQDVLPPYPVLDAILEGLVENERSVESLSKEHPAETVRWVASRLDRNEFKRRQLSPGIKLSQRAFGSGRRFPMAARLDYS